MPATPKKTPRQAANAGRAKVARGVPSMPRQSDFESIKQEQAAFDCMLADLMDRHAGQFALVRDGKLVGLYANHAQAYAAGVAEFGTDAVFLVSEVRYRDPEPTSIAWCSGVMFVQA